MTLSEALHNKKPPQTTNSGGAQNKIDRQIPYLHTYIVIYFPLQIRVLGSSIQRCGSGDSLKGVLSRKSTSCSKEISLSWFWFLGVRVILSFWGLPPLTGSSQMDGWMHMHMQCKPISVGETHPPNVFVLSITKKTPGEVLWRNVFHWRQRQRQPELRYLNHIH